MNLLLDTAAVLWSLEDNPRLGVTARAAIVDPDNEIYVSAACVWEIAIKVSRGRLPVPSNVGEWLPHELAARDFRPLPITVEHAAAVEHLPHHHRDPFDRILIAQAVVEGLRIVTADAQFARYDVPLLRTG